MNTLTYPGYWNSESKEFFKGFVLSEQREGLGVVGRFVTMHDNRLYLPSKNDQFFKVNNKIYKVGVKVYHPHHGTGILLSHSFFNFVKVLFESNLGLNKSGLPTSVPINELTISST